MSLCSNSILNVKSDHQCLTSVLLWHSVGEFKNCLGTHLKTVRDSFRLSKFLMVFQCQIVLTVRTCNPLKLLLVPSKNNWKSYSLSIFFPVSIDPKLPHSICQCIMRRWCGLTEYQFKNLLRKRNIWFESIEKGHGTKMNGWPLFAHFLYHIVVTCNAE